jgi:predicted DNA-binding protein (UPF0251 family)
MARPIKTRIVKNCPPVHLFKPYGIALNQMEMAALTHEEYEAIRLADKEGLSQADGAAAMGISRATFGRLLESAHRTVADALVCGKMIAIEGGDYESPDGEEPVSYIKNICKAQGRSRHGGS